MREGSLRHRPFLKGRLWLCAGMILGAALPRFGLSAPALHFDRDVRPILSENCFLCHGTDANKRKAKLRLDVREVAIERAAIVPGHPESSEVIKRIFSRDEDEMMPPPSSHRHLTDEQRGILRDWIAQGATYEQHWSFIPPARPSLPTVRQKSWPRNPIDSFILAKLEEKKWSPSPEAALPKLLRRVSLDLNGLPPTAEQMQTWSQARDPFAAALKDLLASPHFGERMAVDWMDVSRYADTHGFNNDSSRSMWRWRDWVIDAFNANMPYNQFITEQLAGDLLPDSTLDQKIATGFERNHVINSEGGIIDEEYRVEYVVDRVKTTSLAWMGLTVGCARCHDHKFDPITQKDFYRLYAFFNNVEEWGEDGRIANAAPFIASPTRAQQAEMKELAATARNAEQTAARLLSAQDWTKITDAELTETPRAQNHTSSLPAMVRLDLQSWNSATQTVRNLVGAAPFTVDGEIEKGATPSGRPAMIMHGGASLKSSGLPKGEAEKGWAFSAWVKRGSDEVGPLFSTFRFGVPSSQSYGQGVEIRLGKAGEVIARISRRWPTYAVEVVSREVIARGQWRHVLVTCSGGNRAGAIRIFLDGEECASHANHDDMQASPGIAGPALIGASEEAQIPKFDGQLADVALITGQIKPEQMADDAALQAVVWAAQTPSADRTSYQVGLLRAEYLKRHSAAFAEAEKVRVKNRREELKLDREAPTTMVMKESAQPRTSHVLFRGEYDKPREEVQPGVPEFLLRFPATEPRNRLGLAHWLVDPKNPLTARVVVNRFWQSIFGTGIVKSVEDFGYQADYPSHPELLDWLAVEFISSGWDVKHLLTLIVSSAAYRQDSNSSAEINERDPENRWLSHGPRQRLSAEMLRDQALALSGLLADKIGGPPVFPYQPANLYKGIVVEADYPGTRYVAGTGPDLYRRSLYTFWKRTVPHPTLATFDAPDREVCIGQRTQTDTPLQALALMNDTIQLEAARKFAERMLREGGKTPRARLNFAFRLATGRNLEGGESAALISLLNKSRAQFEANPEAAKKLLSVGDSKADSAFQPSELAAYATAASLMLNLDETITRN